jgi:7-cyano-7-deazaguanine reductase
MKKLGKQTAFPTQPSIKILEAVTNPHTDVNYVSRFTCPEFTSICPVTGQPDFANIVIDYVANKSIVESKSLKLYLGSYRNHGAFHEDCTVSIAKDIIKTIKPKWLRIGGYWYPRGGIPIDVFFEHGKKPKDIFIPEQGVKTYSPRQSY